MTILFFPRFHLLIFLSIEKSGAIAARETHLYQPKSAIPQSTTSATIARSVQGVYDDSEPISINDPML
jgi:hypothetical protein